MPDVASIVKEINTRAEHHNIGRLQETRQKLKGLARLPTRQIFSTQTTFGTYAFHVGGRTELQFNVGFESADGVKQLRHGVAFSLEPSQTLPDIAVLIPKMARFNEFIRGYLDEFSDLRMWHFDADIRSTNYAPAPIPPELVKPKVFICLGRLQPLEQVDYDFVLDDFDRLFPLYRYVEGDASFPAIAESTEPFRFKPGCTIKPIKTSTSLPQRMLDVHLRHNEIQEALYRFLSAQYGNDTVATEQQNGTGSRIDVALRNSGQYWFYEIKTASSARGCIREALAQLLEYSFWPGSQEANRLIVVGEPTFDTDAQAYLALLQKRFVLPIFYQQFDMELGVLLENPIN